MWGVHPEQLLMIKIEPSEMLLHRYSQNIVLCTLLFMKISILVFRLCIQPRTRLGRNKATVEDPAQYWYTLIEKYKYCYEEPLTRKQKTEMKS